MPFHPLTTKHVAGSKTRLLRSLFPTTENPSNHHFKTPAPPTCIQTKDPSTAIQLLLNTFATILAPEVFPEHPTIYQSITNLILPAMVDSVGESLLLPVLPFHTIAIVNENHKSSRRLPGLPGREVAMTLHLFTRRYHIPISPLPTIFPLQVRHSCHSNLLTRTNTSITIHPTNPQSATVRETADHTQGRTILWNGMNPTIISPPPPISIYRSHLPGLRVQHRSKHRPSLEARSESERECITTRG